MRGVVGPAFGDHVAFGQQFVNRDAQVWASGEERAQPLLESISVAHMRGSRIVVQIALECAETSYPPLLYHLLIARCKCGFVRKRPGLFDTTPCDGTHPWLEREASNDIT